MKSPIALREEAQVRMAELNASVTAFNNRVERSLRLEVEIKEVLNEIKQRNNS